MVSTMLLLLPAHEPQEKQSEGTMDYEELLTILSLSSPGD